MIDEKTTQQPEEAGLPNEEPSPSPVPETGSQEPQEAQAPENQQQEPEEQEEAPASGVPEEMELTFHVSYDDVFSVLNLTDKYDGTQKKQKTRVGMLLLVMVLEIISFFQTRNGFILVLAVIFGLLVYRFEMPLGRATLLGVAGIVGVIALGLRFPLYAGYDTWMWLLGLYILVASVTPVWILLQPRDYLSSFLLYAMMLAAVVGIVAAHPVIELPAFTSFEVNGQYLFPALFVTVACGAISGFHSLVASGTTSKQLSSERDARLVGFGSMLIESALGIASLIAVGYIFTQNGHAFTSQTPTQVLADGLSQMLACVGLGSESARGVTYGLIILAVSTFCLTSLDTATRLGRYMFQELWLAPGQSVKDVRGWRAVLVNKYVATLVTVGLGMSLGFGGYAKIWPLFGAANQLLAALALLAVACWLQNLARCNGMFLLPMLFMLLVTLSALVLGIVAQGRALLAGTGGAVAALQLVIAVLLLALSLVLVHEGWQALRRKGRPAAEKA